MGESHSSSGPYSRLDIEERIFWDQKSGSNWTISQDHDVGNIRVELEFNFIIPEFQIAFGKIHHDDYIVENEINVSYENDKLTRTVRTNIDNDEHFKLFIDIFLFYTQHMEMIEKLLKYIKSTQNGIPVYGVTEKDFNMVVSEFNQLFK